MEAIFLMRLKRVEGVIRIMDICVDQDKYVIVMERPKQVWDLADATRNDFYEPSLRLQFTYMIHIHK